MMRSGASAATCVMLFALSLLSASASGVSLNFSTDKEEYQSGDTIEVSLGATNEGEPVEVDLYIALMFPDGMLWTWSNETWHIPLVPWMANVALPAPFDFPTTPLFQFGVPAGVEGYFQFAAAMTAPGTLDFVCDPSLAPFSISNASGEKNVYVDPENGSDSNDGSMARPFLTITNAIRYAETVDEFVSINLAAGRYSAETNGEIFPLNMTSNVELIGQSGGARSPGAILDALNLSRVVNCRGIINALFTNVRITGGWAKDTEGDLCGAGVYVYSSVVTLDSCDISRNTAMDGSGLLCEENSKVTIKNSTFSQNSSQYDGGAISSFDATLTVNNGTFQDNSSDAGGGAIAAQGSALKFDGCNFNGNQAGENGGAVKLADSELDETDCSYVDNSAQSGGGIYIHSINPLGTGKCEMDKSTYSNNSASQNGGAASLNGGYIRMQYCSFYSNSATNGGGAHVSSNSPIAQTHYVEDCNTYSQNSALQNGGAIHTENSHAQSSNSTYQENTAASGGAVYMNATGSYALPQYMANHNYYSMNGAWQNGGAFSVYAGYCRMDYCSFYSNYASYGGSTYINTGNSYYPSTYSSSYGSYTNNSASSYGGGYYVTSSYYRSSNSKALDGPSANRAGEGDNLTLFNDLIVSNTAESGGGMYLEQNITADVRSCTFADNTGSASGGAVYSLSDGASFSDTIFWDDGVDYFNGSMATTFCCFPSGASRGDGDIHDAPVFVTGPLGDYYLDPGSACVDAGSQSAEAAGLSDRTTRTDGTPDTGQLDIGYHYPLPAE